ncbi:hypothetical protein BH11PLA2_BH11PLA2_33800 [soil metagenome]
MKAMLVVGFQNLSLIQHWRDSVRTERIKSRAASKQSQFRKWIVLGVSFVSVTSLGVLAVVTGNRVVAIMTVALPTVAATAWLAVSYGHRHGYG